MKPVRVRIDCFDAYIDMIDKRHKNTHSFEVWESVAWINYYAWEYKYHLN